MLNKIQLIGYLTHDLTIQYLNINNEQIPKLDFQLAVKSKETTQFIPCVAFRKLAEHLHQYLHKGSRIYVEGTLNVQRWTNQRNEKQIKVKVIVSKVIFLDQKLPENAATF
ncbi:MAG: single-stranded DNA-binding protein [Vigna little leaf phytoplasma]|nr:single-stranded DNA-binding protein [Vigna little leaf phytoplasma]